MQIVDTISSTSPRSNFKYEASDFLSIESIDALSEHISGDYNTNDAEGYTALCAAILNNAEPLMILYLTKITAASYDPEIEHLIEQNNYLPEQLRNTKNANPLLKCKKGKTPLQIAIMAGNTVAIETLLGTYTVELTATELVERSSYSFYRDAVKYKDGQPTFVLDDNNNPTDVYDCYKVNVKIDANDLVVVPKDILNAAALQKADILKALASSYSGKWYDDGTLFDKYSSTPLIMATKSQCYESIEFILDKMITCDHLGTMMLQAINHQTSTDPGESAFDIATENEDQGALDLFTPYYTAYSLLEYAFEEDKYALVDSLLLSEMHDSTFDIMHWYDENNQHNLLTHQFTDGEGNRINILQYLNNNYDDSLGESNPIYYFFHFIVNAIKTMSDSDTTEWISKLVQYNCYVFIAYLEYVVLGSNEQLSPRAVSISNAHSNINDESLLIKYIASGCYYLIKLLIKNTINDVDTSFTLNQKEITFISNTDDETIIEFLVEFAYVI